MNQVITPQGVGEMVEGPEEVVNVGIYTDKETGRITGTYVIDPDDLSLMVRFVTPEQDDGE